MTSKLHYINKTRGQITTPLSHQLSAHENVNKAGIYGQLSPEMKDTNTSFSLSNCFYFQSCLKFISNAFTVLCMRSHSRWIEFTGHFPHKHMCAKGHIQGGANLRIWKLNFC